MLAVCSVAVITKTRSQPRIASARSAVKGLRSPSLAPINASPKNGAAPLTALLASARRSIRGATAPHSKMADSASMT